MSLDKKSLYVPLLAPDDESPRQKKNRIIRELLGEGVDITKILTPDYLDDVESLPESYIEAIVGCSFNKHRTLRSFNAFIGKFSELGEKTKKVVAAQAFKLAKAKQINLLDKFYFTDEVVFFHADQLAKKSAKYGRARKFFFYRSHRHALDLIMARVKEIVTPNRDIGPHALEGEEFEQYKKAYLRIEQLPRYLIDEFYKNLYAGGEVETGRQTDRANAYVISHKDCKELFPNLVLYSAHATVKVIFNRSLRSISLTSFQKTVDETYSISVKDLQSFIRCLVEEIETSTFKGKYEDMLELCLVRLMHLSNPHKGLDLDPALLSKCLTIIDNYYLARNREKFFNHVRNDGYTMLSYIRRAVPSFEKYPKLQPLVPYHEGMQKVAAVLDAMEDEKLIKWVKVGQIDPQKELAGTVKIGRFNQKLAARLVTLCGADLDSPDMFSLHHRKEGDLPWENFLFMAVGSHKLGEPWKFYLSCKAQQGKSVNDVLSTVIEFYINCVQWKFGTDVLLGGCYSAIEQLLQDPNVVVTQAMLDKFNVLPKKGEDDGVRKKLQKKMNAKQSVEGKGKEEKEENRVPVARVVAPASAVSAQPAAQAVEEKPESPQELGKRLQRELINFVDINEILELIAKGADVTILGTFTAARQLVYDRVSMGKKLEEVRKVWGQLQQAYGALANVADPVLRLRRILDAQQYEADINDAVIQAGPTAVRELSIRELRKLCRHNLTSNTLGFVLKHVNVKNQEAFDLFSDLRKKNQPILTLIHEACEGKRYEEAYLWLRVLPDADDEAFLIDDKNGKELLLKLILEEEVKAGKSAILQTNKKQWVEKMAMLVKTLHNRLYPQAKSAEVAVVAAPAVEEKRKPTAEDVRNILYMGNYTKATAVLAELDETEKVKVEKIVRTDVKTKEIYSTAIIDGHAEFVSAWIRIGKADVNQLFSGLPAIFIAAYHKKENVVRVLLEEHADVMRKNEQGAYLFNYARNFSTSEIVALIEAALPEEGLIQRVEQLLRDRTVNSEKINQYIKRLSNAVTKLSQEVKESFCQSPVELDREAEDIFIQNGLGALLILNRIRRARPNEISSLVERGVNINDEKALGISPLVYGVQNGYLGVIIPVVEAGAKVTENVYANAAEFQHGVVIQFLREKYPVNPEFMFLCDELSGGNPSFEQIAKIPELEEKKKHLTEKQRNILARLQAKNTPAALLGKVVVREDAHPVHARKNSGGEELSLVHGAEARTSLQK